MWRSRTQDAVSCLHLASTDSRDPSSEQKHYTRPQLRVLNFRPSLAAVSYPILEPSWRLLGTRDETVKALLQLCETIFEASLSRESSYRGDQLTLNVKRSFTQLVLRSNVLVSLQIGHTCHFGVYTEVLSGAQSQGENFRSHFSRAKKVFASVVYQLLQLYQDLLHLWNCPGAVDQLAHFWMSKLIGGDEGQQGDRFASPSGHLHGIYS